MPDHDIHQQQPVLSTGAALSDAHAAVILLHGRGSMAQNILGLAEQLPQDRIVYLAPQAANNNWYPLSGFLPVEENQPYVSSAFETVASLLVHITDAGISPDRIVLGGFSQGACLAAEFVARHPRRYGGLVVLSGALLGPADMPRQYPGSLDGTPVFIGGWDHDPWVTEHQHRLTGDVFQTLGGSVHVEIHAGALHTIRQTEIEFIRDLLTRLTGNDHLK